mgnify:CR=1 FL=1
MIVLAGLTGFNQRIEESVKFMNWGFRAWKSEPIVAKGKKVETADVQLGTANHVGLIAPGQVRKNEIPAGAQLVVLGGNYRDVLTDSGRALYRKTVIDFDAIIKKHGGHTALYWLPPHGQPGGSLASAEHGRRLEEMTLAVANEVGALVIPVGLAFREAYRQRPGVKLQMGYDDYRPMSFLEVDGAREVGIEFHSLSKTFNMTGWQIGRAHV